MPDTKYCEYFDIDENYFPCIDEAAIRAGAPWDNTWPHDTFIAMLVAMERALARQNNHKSLWIYGSYGTGKSQCAYAMRKILELPENDVRDYWNKYEPLQLKQNQDLLTKLIGQKKSGILVAHRYASGAINTPRDLFFAIQESVQDAIDRQKLRYRGENTLKESIIAWLEDIDHSAMVDRLLQNSEKEWKGLFSQSTADEILNALRKGSNVNELVAKIFRLADKEGITALSIDSDRLIAWLTDIIDQNQVKIVLIWDEFSDYFRNNSESLSEFQKVAALVQDRPFYLVVVTHEPKDICIGDRARNSQSKVSDRFVPIPILLPDNIAFNLIGHAFTVKQAARTEWEPIANELNSEIEAPRKAVMDVAKISSENVIKKIMPIHPMTALLLKHIATSFKSNQRSMFDFIKTSITEEVHAFQWFITNHGPSDDQPLLTVDMLWNFFYETGKENLSSDTRRVLDTFQQQQNLKAKEQAVLKAILIMQAIDERLGGSIGLFKATDINLDLVFAGIADLNNQCSARIAQELKNRGILVSVPAGDGKKMAYRTAVLAGDQAKIDDFKKDIDDKSTAANLVTTGGLGEVLSLGPALSLRFEEVPESGALTCVTRADFLKKINTLRDRADDWRFKAVIAFEKDQRAAEMLRQDIRKAVADEQYKDIIFIDALSTPLGDDAYNQYRDYSALAMYLRGNNKTSSDENATKATQVLSKNWKDRICRGFFMVYTHACPDGDKISNSDGIPSVLQKLVRSKYPQVFDFNQGLTENHLKHTQIKASAKSGIVRVSSGIVVGLEKKIFPAVWNVDRYWAKPEFALLPISIIKIAVDKKIKKAFEADGQVKISEIYEFLTTQYGFAPSNLSAFIAGFLLKEYCGVPYRYSDSRNGHSEMTPDILAEMLAGCIGKESKPTYIVLMTKEDKAFYRLTADVWDANPETCISEQEASSAVCKKMRSLELPVWCLKEIAPEDVYEVVQDYIEFVQSEGQDARKKAALIGKKVILSPALTNELKTWLTPGKCQEGMREFLKSFEHGKIPALVKDIHAESRVLLDIAGLFTGVKHSCLWNRETGEDEICKLITRYGIVKVSNEILKNAVSSIDESFENWRSQLSFLHISCEALRTEYPTLNNILDVLLMINERNETSILPEQLQVFYQDLEGHRDQLSGIFIDVARVFARIYKAYLEDFSEKDINTILGKLKQDMFGLSKTECNTRVKSAADDYRNSLLKTQLLSLWQEKTRTKNPVEWSDRYKTPILSCVPDDEFDMAKRAFEALNRNDSTEAEIGTALEYLQGTRLFESLNDSDKRDEAFRRDIIGEYDVLLLDTDAIRRKLDILGIAPYNWRDNPSVRNKIRTLAKAEYEAGGSDRVIAIIDQLSGTQLKQYLKELIKTSMHVGVEIIMKEKGGQHE